jgi:4a-hydroxytetrahydrobiopterin dehydratase
MGDEITAQQFHDSDGVDDWRVLSGVACTYFRTGSFATGVALIDEIARLADAADHHPDVDLRYPGVTVRLSSHDIGGLSRRDAALAREISAAARAMDVPADPAAATPPPSADT